VTSDQAKPALHDLCRATPGRVLLALGARDSGALRRSDHTSVSAALTESTQIPMLLAPPGLLARLGAHRARSLAES